MKKGTSTIDLIFALGMFGLFLIPTAIYGQWWLFATFAIFGCIFGILEVVAKKKSGKTVTQHFKALKERNKTGAWIIIGCMIVAWALLIAHLVL